MNPELNTLLAGLGIVLYGLALAAQSRLRGRTWPARALALLALALHGAVLHNDLIRQGQIYFSFGPAVSLFAWQCALLVWLFALLRPVGHLCYGVFPLAAAALAQTWFPANTSTDSFSSSWPLGMHVLLSLLAYGLLTIAALQAIAVLLQDRGLRQHHNPGWLQKLPPLETMEQLLFQLMALGLFMLTLSLLSGLLFVDDLFAQHLVHKTALSLFAWLVFAILLWGRWQFGWRGRPAINWTLGGYVSLLLAYFGSKWVLEAILGTSWG